MELVVVEPEGVPTYEGEVPDIEYGKWYDTAMQNAFTLGLIEPNHLGYLSPDYYSTREEVVDVLIRCIGALGIDIDPVLKTYGSDFKDFDQVSDELKESMTIAINLGFISGMSDGRIAPKEEITRGQIAAVVKKLYLYVLDELES
jgi:hypothetical protein